MKPAERLYAKASRALAEGQVDLALETAGRLVERFPRSAAGHALLGAIHQQRRDRAAAVAAHREAAALAPDDPAILNNLGLALREAGDARASVDVLREAVRLRPAHAIAHNNLGLSLLETNQPEGAVRSFRDAIAARPDYPKAHHNLGNALRRLGRREEGTASLREALRLDTLYGQAWNSLGAALHADGAWADAESAFARALQIRPHDAKAHLNRAHLHADLERHDDALAGYRQALALQPGYAKALLGLAALLQRQGQIAPALDAAGAAVAQAPRSAEAHVQRAAVQRAAGRMADALASYEQALALDPELDAARAGRLELRSEQCDWRDREEDVARLRTATREALGRGEPPPLSASAAHRFVPCGPEEQLALARVASDRLASRLAGLRVALGPPPSIARDRLRVGYLSCDFRNNAVGHLTQGLFRSHDRSRVEAIAYSYGPDDGTRYRRRIEEDAERFVDLATAGTAEAARRIRDDGVDVLVDLVGAAGNSRPEILALRPAPVQVHFLGYPATVGRALVDYFVADPVTVPPGAERFFDEAVVRLPDSYQLNDDRQEIAATAPTRAECGLPATGFVFACFNANYKIDPPAFDAWVRILGRVPGSVLWLLETAPATVAHLRQEAGRRGIEAGRLVFARLVDKPVHLARQRHAGLFLDTPQCNAHTTASDALWAGLPVVTTPGETFASRVAASLLAAAGLPELVAPDLGAYEETAVRLAHDAPALRSIADRLRADPGRLPLFDTARTVRHLERAYAEMWARHRRGEPPAGFAVGPDGPLYSPAGR